MFLACEILSAAAEQSRRAGERATRILPLTSTRVFSIIIMYICTGGAEHTKGRRKGKTCGIEEKNSEAD